MTGPHREQARQTALQNWAQLANRAGLQVPPPGMLAELARFGGVPPAMRSMPGIVSWEPTILWLMQQADSGVSTPELFLPPHLRMPRSVPPAGQLPGPHPGQGSFVAPGAAPARPAEPFGSASPAPVQPAPAPQQTQQSPGAAQATPEPQLSSAPRPPVPQAAQHTPAAPEPTAGHAIHERLERLHAWHSQAVQDGMENIWQLKETHLRLVSNARVTTADEIRSIFPPVAGQFADELASALAVPAQAAAADAPVGTGQPAAGESGNAPAGQASDATQTPVSPAPAAPAEQQAEPEPDDSVDPEDFAPYEYGVSAERPRRLRSVPRDRALRLSWPESKPGGGSEESEPVFIVDRLVASDEYPPYSPDSARLIAATTATAGVDDMPFTHAVRHYQVWRNRGASLEDAKQQQPELYAETQIVAPVQDLDLREDEGRVIGQWSVLPGTTRVQVFRIPVQKAAGASGDPIYRILADEANLGGFVDTEAARGQRYLYQVFAEAELDGLARLSAPISNELLISAVHEPVRDLSFALNDSEDAPFFDLRWSEPPGGQVVIYRTEQPPQPGIDRQAVSAAALPNAGLPVSAKLAHPITLDGEQSSMRDVPWPRGWTRAYFTAVVLVSDRAFVGNTVRGVRVPRVQRPRIIERVNRQVLTFEWPDGADVVLAYKSARDVSSHIAVQGQAMEISRNDYRERGGFEFEAGQLDASGCDLHLVSVAFDGGNRVMAEPEVVNYQGLLRIEYRTIMQPGPGGVPAITVQLRSHADVMYAPPFVLVHREDRLPLTIDDGRPVAVMREGGTPQRRFTPSPLTKAPGPSSTWFVEPGAFAQEARPGGYLRLFADLPPEKLRCVALIDPPIGNLRVPGAPSSPPAGGAYG